MINLFETPRDVLDLGRMDHLLHGKEVRMLEDEFKEFVGAHHAVTVNSATNAIFLALKFMQNENFFDSVQIPTMLPSVVANAALNAGLLLHFNDNVDWVGNSYLLHETGTRKLIDSAQQVKPHQFVEEAQPVDLMVFSFYPTKPVGGFDGGIIVSDDHGAIEWLREATMNGTTTKINSWDRTTKFAGWKMYLTTPQAQVALNSLRGWKSGRQARVQQIRDYYNQQFGLANRSEHLYRINVKNRGAVREALQLDQIACGIHYKPLHTMKPYDQFYRNTKLHKSETEYETTLSIPMHWNLSDEEIKKVVTRINACRE